MHILASTACTSAVLHVCVWVMYIHVVQMTSLMTGGLVVHVCVFLCIQIHERARQGRLRAKFMREIRCFLGAYLFWHTHVHSIRTHFISPIPHAYTH